MPTFKIHIKGIVQGVGFRPFVYQQALADKIRGTVSNGSDGVIIFFDSDTIDDARNWLDKLLLQAPKLSKINTVQLEVVPSRSFEDFRIIESDDQGEPDLPVTPDFAICEQCKIDIENKGDARYRYAFTTCCQCGPRYSITRKIPYDRPHTTMDNFEMCPDCLEEYNNPLDRRHFSQTNSCPDCGVELSLFDCHRGEFTGQLSEDEMLRSVRDSLLEGQIIAVKGIGGYLVVCDASNDDAVNLLRERKIRRRKPFAVMYPDIASIRDAYELSANEEKALTGPVAPIVLLNPKKSTSLSSQVAPGLENIGVMIPYAPLLHLIARSVDLPLVATSANVSGSTIVYDDEEAVQQLSGIADWILMNNRDILVPQDDSVVRFTWKKGRRIILRRSRGLAPNYFGKLPDLGSLEGVLATGAEMKGAFAVVRKGMLYISQYLGSMHTLHSQESYEKVLTHLSGLTGFRRSSVLADLHPEYFGNRWAKEVSERENIKFDAFQHHEAHFASVLAENDLLNTQEPVLGFVWDGTGLSPEGQIWGSETFLFDRWRIHHIDNVGSAPHISGDQMSRHPRLALLAFAVSADLHEDLWESLFSTQELKIYRRLIEKSTLSTSSMGRLFDAVSCLVTGITENSYEGEAAMQLESLARKALETDTFRAVHWELNDEEDFATEAIKHVWDGLNRGLSKDTVALAFHEYLVTWISHQAAALAVNKLAFSGGVFQNALLVDLIDRRLSDKYELYYHHELSPNDENIAHGQVMMLVMQQKQKKRSKKKQDEVCK